MQAALLKSGENPFGITSSQVTALMNGATGLNTAIDAEKAATRQKTDTQLATLGLPPRRSGTPRPKPAAKAPASWRRPLRTAR